MRICGVRDNLGNAECLWPAPLNKDLGIYCSGDSFVEEAVSLVIDPRGEGLSWNQACGTNLYLSTNPKTAKLVIATGKIDGPQGTLAWCELPCGFTERFWKALKALRDSSEMWVIAKNPPSGKIDIVRTLGHEIGHFLGIPHIGEGNLMAAMYSNAIRWLREDDIAQGRLRYGLPFVPDPNPDPPNPGPVKPDPGFKDKLFPCLLDAALSLDREERKELISFALLILRNLSKEQKEKLFSLLR